MTSQTALRAPRPVFDFDTASPKGDDWRTEQDWQQLLEELGEVCGFATSFGNLHARSSVPPPKLLRRSSRSLPDVDENEEESSPEQQQQQQVVEEASNRMPVTTSSLAADSSTLDLLLDVLDVDAASLAEEARSDALIFDPDLSGILESVATFSKLVNKSKNEFLALNAECQRVFHREYKPATLTAYTALSTSPLQPALHGTDEALLASACQQAFSAASRLYDLQRTALEKHARRLRDHGVLAPAEYRRCVRRAEAAERAARRWEARRAAGGALLRAASAA